MRSLKRRRNWIGNYWPRSDRQGLYLTAKPAGPRRQLKHYHELSWKSQKTHYDRKADFLTANTSVIRRTRIYLWFQQNYFVQDYFVVKKHKIVIWSPIIIQLKVLNLSDDLISKFEEVINWVLWKNVHILLTENCAKSHFRKSFDF